MLMAMQVGKAQAAADAWAPEGSVDMLALFSASLPLGPTASDGSGGSSGRRSRAAAALPLPPLPLPPLPFALPLLPLPDAAAVSALGSLPAFDPVAAAAYLLNPTAAANLAAAATALAEQPEGKEDSLADAASFPAVLAAPAPAPSLPPVGQPFNMTSALTSHLSDVAGPGDVEMHGEAWGAIGLEGAASTLPRTAVRPDPRSHTPPHTPLLTHPSLQTPPPRPRPTWPLPSCGASWRPAPPAPR